MRSRTADRVESPDPPAPPPSQPDREPAAPNPERAKDQEFFAEFYHGLKPLLSKPDGALYWKGALTLVDGSRADVVAMEDPDDPRRSYSIATSSKEPAIADLLPRYRDRKFRSARHAVLHFERDLNQALYRAKKG